MPIERRDPSFYLAYKDSKLAYKDSLRRQRIDEYKRQREEQWWITWFCCPDPGDASDIPCCPCGVVIYFAFFATLAGLYVADKVFGL